jgi:methylthioribose-1-phosphate isomerase
VLASVLDECTAAWGEDASAVDLPTRLAVIAAIRAAGVRAAIGRVAAETARLLGTLSPGDLVLHGAMSTRACGEVGLASAVVGALRTDGRRATLVATSSPTEEGLATRDDLVRSGVTASLVADASVGAVLAKGGVTAVLVAAEWVATDGSILAPAGALALAVLAAVHQVPLLVLDASGVEPRPLPVLAAARPEALDHPTNDAPPLVDVVPAELVTALVIGAGVA